MNYPEWPIILGYLAFQVGLHDKSGVNRGGQAASDPRWSTWCRKRQLSRIRGQFWSLSFNPGINREEEIYKQINGYRYMSVDR